MMNVENLSRENVASHLQAKSLSFLPQIHTVLFSQSVLTHSLAAEI